MTAVIKSIDWLEQFSSGLSILIPQNILIDAKEDIQQFESRVRTDPLLSLQVFSLAFRNVKTGTQPETLYDALVITGVESVIQFAAKLQRLDLHSGGSVKLLQSIGDSLVATSLLKSWHDWRQVEWRDSDHWACLFSSAPEWFVAYKDPMLLDGIEYRVNGGESLSQIFNEIFGFNYEELYAGLISKYHLPSLQQLGQNNNKNGTNVFKYQALNYYLPISNQLATTCRRSWGTPGFDALVKRAMTATMIDDFSQALPGWLAEAARINDLYACHESILNYFQEQPGMTVAGYVSPKRTTSRKVSGKKPLPRKTLSKKIPSLVVEENNKRNTKAIANSVQKNIVVNGANTVKTETLETRISRVKVPTGRPKLTQPAKKPSTETPARNVSSILPELKIAEQNDFKRGDTDALDEIVYLFSNQVVRYSNEVVAFKSLIGALEKGMGFSRSIIALYQPSVGQIRVQYRHGTENRLQLHNLAFAVPESGIIAKLVEKPVSFWLKPENAQVAWKNLPRRFGEAVNCQEFFIKSIHVNDQFRALIYADVYNQPVPLGQSEYNRFRNLIGLVEKAVNQSTPISSSNK